MMNQRINDGINVNNYFDNNGKGFDNPRVIKINDLNIKIEVYSNNLRESKAVKVESEIRETVNNFKDSFSLKSGQSEQILKIYIFNDKEDYTNLGGSKNFNFGLENEGGKFFYRGEPGVFGEMYVYQQGNVHNLKHELAHGLTYLATGGKSLPTVLMEGIADYFEHHSSHKFNAQGSSIDVTKDKNLSLNQILNLEYSPHGEENSLVYKTGQALVMYLQEKDPNLLSDYLRAISAGDASKSQSLLNQIMQHNDDFKSWLAENNTDVAMKDINALQVTKGEYIATKKEIVSGEIKDVSYYKANIEKMNGEKVGSFSPVDHISFHGFIRATNKATGTLLDISKGEYSFLKVVSTPDGNKLTYSDKHGNEYQDSKEYKQQALRILSKYGEDLEESSRIKEENLKNEYNKKSKELDQLKDKEYDGVLKGLVEQREAQLRDVSEKLSARKISYEEFLKEDSEIIARYYSEDQKRYSATEAKYAKLKSDLQNKYEKERTSLLDEVIKDGLKQVKETKGIDVEKMLEGLITLDPSSIRNTRGIDLSEGKIFSLKALGQGMTGGLSIYDGDTKLGELSSETGFFKQVEGSNKESFFFQDVLHNMHVKYDGGAYMAVTKENGQYKASFVDGRKVNSDEYYKEPHLHENELLNPSINHINEKNLDSLLLKDTKIVNHKDSELAQYSDDQKEHGIIIEKGKVLDDKGTDRTDDDVHAAVVKQEGKDLHEFKNMGFYITEEVKNSKGDVIDKSDLFIHDHGKNVRFQLPNDITHLKLVKKDGEHKLVPSTKDGNEHPEGMPSIPDEYRYIDPIFAHEYEKRDYSHKHVNIGLINLDKYKSGTLFSIKHDPNDYHIQRNSAGKIVRMNDNAYFTKVKLFHDDKEIGMLSNNFHNFKDKIFFSADYNYSYNDFLASVSPQVEVENMKDGSKKITFDQSVGDVGNTNRGYTDHQRIFVKNNELTQEKNQERSDAENSNSKTIKQTQIDVGSSNKQASGDLFSHMSNSQSNDRREEFRKDNQEKKVPLDRVRRSSGEEDEMQSDKPMDAEFVKEVKHQQKVMNLKANLNSKDYVDNRESHFQSNFATKTQKVGSSPSNDHIILDFQITRGEPIGQYKFSACIQLHHLSKQFFQNEFPNVKFNSFDRCVELDTKNFYIQSGFNDRDELCIRDNSGRYTLANVPTGYEIISVKLFPEGEVLSYGVHPIVNYSGGYYNGNYNARENRNDNNDLLPIFSRVINDIFSGIEGASKEEIFSRMHSELVAIRDREVKDDALEQLVEKGEVVLYKVTKGDKIDEKRSEIVLKLSDKNGNTLEKGSIILDRNKFYLEEKYIKHDHVDEPEIKQFVCVVENGSVNQSIEIFNNIFFVNNNSKFSLDDGFYSIYFNSSREFWQSESHDHGLKLKIQHSRIDNISNEKIHEVLNAIKNSHEMNNEFQGKDNSIETNHEQSVDLRANFNNKGGSDLYNKHYATEMQHDQTSKTMNKDILNDQHYRYEHAVEKRSLDDTKIQHQPLVKVLHDEQKTIILKNTIIKIEKSHEQDSQGRHKVNVTIDYDNVKSLYDRAEEVEKDSVLKFWHKLHKSEYKVGTLPEGKYYFSKGKFFIHDNQEKKMIVLPEDKISVKIMKSGDSYKLVISNDKGGVINSVDKVDNLNYDLLSDFSNINLETEGSIKLADQHMEYNTYLINGLDGKILNDHDNGHDHYHDNSLI